MYSLKPLRWITPVVFCLALALSAIAKPIRLQNEQIDTPPGKSRGAQLTSNKQLSPLTLVLIQFAGPLDESARAQLRNAGVQLVRYVPDDTYIARLAPSRLSDVHRLPYVHWVGPYQAHHKLHRSISNLTNAAPVAVRVLFSPDAPAREVARVRASLGGAQGESVDRFGTIVQGMTHPKDLPEIAASDAVLWVERAPRPKLFDEIATKIISGDDLTNATRSVTQQLGFDGSGVVVAVADSGLHGGTVTNMHPDLIGRVDAFFHYGNLTNAADEHSHGTHVSGIIAANAATGEKDENGFFYGLGVAPGAHLVAQRIFDGLGNYEPPSSFDILTRDAVRAGADIGSNSWGDDTQGEYDLSAAQFDALVRDADPDTLGDQPYILEFSAGNAGPGAQTIGSPAVAKNVIATGASENNRPDLLVYADGIDAMADFSSRGPCADGRIKPDLVAPGTWIASTRSVYADDNNAWAPISENYLYQGGTSQAGPHASGAAAVFVQYYRQTHTNATPSPALVKAALINSAVDMDDAYGTGPIPNNDEGWGRIDLTRIMASARRSEFLDQAVTLSSGQIFEKHIVVASSSEPLKITLTYTDVPGLPAAIPALVNDLDLEVVDPNGNIYHGNQFDDFGDSAPNVVAFDNLNNVEAVHLYSPDPGEYVVRIRARNVAEDARRDTAAVDQDFALVVSGDLPSPGSGVLFFDRGAYRAPDTIKIKLIDFDLSAQPTVSIYLKSTTESLGETIILSASSSGIFTGNVATVTGTAISDGRLQVADRDLIDASYTDASPAATRTAHAVADLTPPVISNVGVTNIFGKTVITWTTSEPATSIAGYRTNGTFSSATNSGRVTDHQVALDDINAGATYEFFVVSKDEAGNVTTNNNGGTFFSFVGQQPPTVLLVDAYVVSSVQTEPPIPRSTYTDPLDQSGFSYDVWDVSANGSPTARDLRPYRVVIWRINDSAYSSTTLSASEQSAITNYLGGGGSFFMGSMELLSRLGANSPFRTNIFRVQSFAEDVGVPAVDGVDNDPITSGLLLSLDYSAYPDLTVVGLSQDLSDTMRLTTNAAPIFFDTASNRVAGMRFPKVGEDSPSRVVFLSFPFDAVGTNSRPALLRNIISFLAPGENGLGTIAFDNSEYTAPARAVVEVADQDLAGQSTLNIRAYTTTETNGQTFVLSETPRRGLFRGYIDLISFTNAPRAGALRVKNGDDLWAEYFDASRAGFARVTASIDTLPPAITNVVVVPEYGEATVSWTTTEPADSLVEFGESTFLGRTGYEPDLVIQHEVVLSGLVPDHIYYFKVTSQDNAGNTVEDDNRGRFYSFRTLRPVRPPWSDNLENSGTNWSVVSGDLTQVAWQLGKPNNTLATTAFSGTNSWGCNLYGQNIDQAQTLLVSPAFELVGGNFASLHFWDNYDFPDLSGDVGEIAQLYISTNSGRGWIALADFTGSSFGWQEEEIDLTPYLGKVVRLGWYYELLSFEPHGRPGWLVDDISVNITNVILGSVTVTNNLAQAHVAVSGPVFGSATGWNLLITNAPVGQYVATWNPVPYYITPPPQTNNLTSSNRLAFRGTYTFVDANSNGISDAWEQHYFGSVSPTRTALTDSDRDGLSDYAEFMAGTDPTNRASFLGMTSSRTNRTFRFAWPTVPNYAYQLQGSTNGFDWTPMLNWYYANSTSSVFNFTPAGSNAPYLFRLQVKP